ncbi:hypothetical protein Pan153_53310 [Gimesia panareensis]|uniref:Uncharacterized protein n=2 Tax=Gimesia panareensis TaxID=2527978 RepID=A0A518FWA8_9PLAN|nr:hypothetical protein Pan153_53310 [Gimesia panareensis]
MSFQNGTRFNVASKQICGIMKRTRDVSGSILVKPASDYYERMTHYGWEPVYVGEDSDPGKND